MADILSFPGPYLPEYPAAVADMDNADSDLDHWSGMFSKDPFEVYYVERLRFARERFHKAAEYAWAARFREVSAVLTERGRI